MCHGVTVIMSGQMIFRPALHIPVKSRHRSQNPSRIAILSWVDKPQQGHVHLLTGRRKKRLGAEGDIVRPSFAHRLAPRGQAPVITARYVFDTEAYIG
jgi:hypothetical protein